MLATSRRCRPGLPLLSNLRGRNEHKSFGTPTPSLPTKRYRGSWGPTDRNSASWHRSEAAPYLPDRREMYPKGKTYTPWCSMASLMRWPRLLEGQTADTPSKTGSSRRPLMTFKEQEYQDRALTPSVSSRRPHLDTKKTEERSTST